MAEDCLGPDRRRVVRRLCRRMRDIEMLYEELRRLEEQIGAPTPEELDEIVHARRPLTLDALLGGVIAKASFHLDEARRVIDDYRPYTHQGAARVEPCFWRPDLKKSIENRVERRTRARRDRERNEAG